MRAKVSARAANKSPATYAPAALPLAISFAILPPPSLLPPSSNLPSLTHSSARSRSPGLAAALTVPPRLRALRLAIALLAIPASGASGSCAPAFQVYWRAGSGVLTPVPLPPPPEVGSRAAAATRPPSKRGHASPTHATSMSAILPHTPPPPPPLHTHSCLQLPPYVSRVRLLPTPSAVPPPGCLCARPPPCGARRAHRGVWHLRRPQPQTAAGAIPVGCTATTSATRPGAALRGAARRCAARRCAARHSADAATLRRTAYSGARRQQRPTGAGQRGLPRGWRARGEAPRLAAAAWQTAYAAAEMPARAAPARRSARIRRGPPPGATRHSSSAAMWWPVLRVGRRDVGGEGARGDAGAPRAAPSGSPSCSSGRSAMRQRRARREQQRGPRRRSNMG